MDKNQTLRKDLIEAWERYVNKTNTSDDLALILDSIMDDGHIQEFNEVFSKLVWNRAMNELPPTSEERKELYRKKATQLLAEYESKQKMQTIQIPARNRFHKIWYAAAAVLLLGFLIPATYLYMKPKAVQYVEMATQRGEIKTVFLPDKTEVTLNAGSRIKYPAHFSDNKRSVELYGEALFDVTPDPARPFTVQTENINIKVVGTVFNVKEYAEDLTAAVSVASGKVEVGFLANERVMLEQDQQFKIDKTTGLFEKTAFDADKYLSWRENALYFHRTPIREVVNLLNRHYTQVNIQLAEGDYSDILISGESEDVHTAEEILSSIVYTTGLKYTKTGGNEYFLYN